MGIQGLAGFVIGVMVGTPVSALALNQTEIIQTHIHRLGRDYARVYQQEAASALVQIGPAAVPFLIQALSTPDTPRRIHVIEVLGDLKDPKAMDFLLREFENTSSKEIQCKIVEALGKLRAPLLYDFFASRVEDPDAGLRCFAIWSLGELRLQKAVPLLLEVLRTEDGYPLITAIDALGKTGLPEQSTLLLEYLKYENIQTRFVTAKALGEIGDARVVPALLHAMVKEPDPEVQEALAQTLGKIGGDAALSKLVQLIKEKSSPTLQHLAETGLESAGLQAAFYLMPFLKGDDFRLRLSAAKILGAIRAPGAIPYLVQMAEEKNPTARVVAITALGGCGDISVMALLTHMARSDEMVIREAAAEAMKKIAARNEQLYQETRKRSG
ncbi:MAG: HEAT repeat domain-containing protein [Elusimicrobiota bacterium]|jgi:HEAT repeat protein